MNVSQTSVDLFHIWPEPLPSFCTLTEENMLPLQGTSGQHLWGPETVLSLNIVPSCVTLGRLLNFSELQVPYLHEGVNNAKLKRLSQGLNESVFAKCLPCLTRNISANNVDYHY